MFFFSPFCPFNWADPGADQMDVHGEERLPRHHLPQLEARLQCGPHHVLPAAGNTRATATTSADPDKALVTFEHSMI